MRRALVAAILSVFAVAAHSEALTMESLQKLPAKEVEKNLPDSHPMAYLAYAVRLYKEGKGDPATKWYYIGQIRYKHHLLAHPEATADAQQLADTTKGFGQAVTDYAGGNIRIWVQSIDQALSWDNANPNNFTSKETFATQLQEVRAEVTKTRDNIKRNEAQIKAERASKGMTDR
jgi:hypothetical protein